MISMVTVNGYGWLLSDIDGYQWHGWLLPSIEVESKQLPTSLTEQKKGSGTIILQITLFV